MNSEPITTMALLNCDRRIIAHLTKGGTPDDSNGQKLIRSFVGMALSDPQIREECVASGWSSEDLVWAYSTIVRNLMPSPCVLSPDARRRIPVLLATMFFANAYNRHSMLLCLMDDLKGLGGNRRNDAIQAKLAPLARQIWESETNEKGKVELDDPEVAAYARAKGCFGVMLVLCSLGVGILTITTAMIILR